MARPNIFIRCKIKTCKNDIIQYAEDTEHIKFFDILQNKGYYK